MTTYEIKIKSAMTSWVWYSDKIGETFIGYKHHTDSLFWFPGDVYKTPYGYIHEQDAEEISSHEDNIDPFTQITSKPTTMTTQTALKLIEEQVGIHKSANPIFNESNKMDAIETYCIFLKTYVKSKHSHLIAGLKKREALLAAAILVRLISELPENLQP